MSEPNAATTRALPLPDSPADSSLKNERFGFTLFMSLCVHAVLILGIGFTWFDETNTASSMEITLALFQSAERPEEADFLAQANQLGSGSEEGVTAPSTPVESVFHDDVIQDVSTLQQEQFAHNPLPDNLLTADRPDAMQAAADDRPEENNPDVSASESLQTLDQRLASLQAQLDIHREAYANRPRRHTITAASTQSDRDASYLDNWRRRIETIGNLNYPQQASANGIYGQLRLLVALRNDGSVNEVRVLSSSGHAILDQAAIEIVRLAAPFDPFPEEMRRDVDILEIIRTWQFRSNNSLSSF